MVLIFFHRFSERNHAMMKISPRTPFSKQRSKNRSQYGNRLGKKRISLLITFALLIGIFGSLPPFALNANAAVVENGAAGSNADEHAHSNAPDEYGSDPCCATDGNDTSIDPRITAASDCFSIDYADDGYHPDCDCRDCRDCYIGACFLCQFGCTRDCDADFPADCDCRDCWDCYWADCFLCEFGCTRDCADDFDDDCTCKNCEYCYLDFCFLCENGCLRDYTNLFHPDCTCLSCMDCYEGNCYLCNDCACNCIGWPCGDCGVKPESCFYCGLCADCLTGLGRSICPDCGYCDDCDELLGFSHCPDCDICEKCHGDNFCSVCGKCGDCCAGHDLCAGGHDLAAVWTELDAPDCTNTGWEFRRCSRFADCGYEEEQVIPALGHDYLDYDEPADCENDGAEGQACFRCSEKANITVINKLGHDWSAWIDDGDGENFTRTCTRFGCIATQNTYLPLGGCPGHDFAGSVTINTPATCLTEGLQSVACLNCASARTESIPTVAHVFGDYTTKTLATCELTGEEEAVCLTSGCNARNSRIIPVLNHDFGTSKDDGTHGCKRDKCKAAEICAPNAPGTTCAVCGYLTPAQNNSANNDSANNGSGNTPANTADENITAAANDSINDTLVNALLSQRQPTIRLSQTNGNIISARALQAVKESGKDLTVILNNGFEYTIIADSIGSSVKNFDLRINIHITGPAETIDGVTVPANSIVISPNFQGEFGFEIQFRFTAAELTAAGLNGNNTKLLYVGHDGNITDLGNAKLNSDGSVEFTISHASYYILTEAIPKTAPKTGEVFSETRPTAGAIVITLGLIGLMLAGSLFLRKGKR